MPREDVSGAGSGVLPATECRTRTMAFTSAGWAGISLERKSGGINHVQRETKNSAAQCQQRTSVRNGRAIWLRLHHHSGRRRLPSSKCLPTLLCTPEKLRLLLDP